MSTKSARIELRADPEREQRIRYAAKLRHQSLSAFVLEAASDRAESVIATSSATSVSAEFFDALWAALDEPPAANEALRRRATGPRKVEQRQTMSQFVSEALDEHHDLSDFTSGVLVLDRWLQSSSSHAQRMRTARTFVWHAGDDVVRAYYSGPAGVSSSGSSTG